MNHLEKIIGIAMPEHVANHCTRLCPRLWAELDIIPLVLSNATLIDRVNIGQVSETRDPGSNGWSEKTIDEQAESMARKGVRLVGPAQCHKGAIGSKCAQAIWTGQHAPATSGLLRACGSRHSLPCANGGSERFSENRLG